MIAEATHTTNIWILEDHELFAKQIRRLIAGEDDLTCSQHFTSAADLYDKLKFTNERPDLLLLDLGLPRRDGLQVLADLRSLMPEVKVLILTSFDDREKVYRAICNGASGYILKTADPDEILGGIRDVIHGASALSAPIAKMILDGFSRHGPVAANRRTHHPRRRGAAGPRERLHQKGNRRPPRHFPAHRGHAPALGLSQTPSPFADRGGFQSSPPRHCLTFSAIGVR